MTDSKNSRRNFLKTGIALSSVSIITLPVLPAVNNIKNNINPVKENYTILFQGDSITDGGRTRDNDWNHLMGSGFVYIIASKLWYDYPETKFKIFNRGISGNKITDLEQRWDEDTIALKPDLINILVGINDVNVFINGGNNFTAEQYETKYRGLLTKTRAEFPAVQFVLCEPFILPVGQVKNKFELFDAEIKKRQQVVAKLAIEFNAVHIPFQTFFNDALKKAAADYWIWDGIHPMPAGHEMMALEWLKLVGKKLELKVK